MAVDAVLMTVEMNFLAAGTVNFFIYTHRMKDVRAEVLKAIGCTHVKTILQVVPTNTRTTNTVTVTHACC